MMRKLRFRMCNCLTLFPIGMIDLGVYRLEIFLGSR
jgi:hypothetical protein